MKMFESLKIGESCSLNSFASLTGLKIDEMHLAVEVSLRNTDKYKILDNIEQMIEYAKNDPYGQIYSLSGKPIGMEEAELKLEDLRRWFITEYCYDIMENCNKVIELQRALADKDVEMKRHNDDLKQKMVEWNKEKEKMAADMEAMNKKDEWSSRVTYDAVVDQIAACEDAKERDEARKLIEPLLKKDMATKFRRDIRNKAQALSNGGTNITIEKVEGDFNVNKTVKQIDN